MKRYGNLFGKIIDINNLIAADAKARRGKICNAVLDFDKNRDGNLLKLQQMLQDGKFRTSPYHRFKIFEHKEREIFSLPYFPDRIVHHAIMNILEPIFRKVFTLNIVNSEVYIFNTFQ